jgi:hypothetical protein
MFGARSAGGRACAVATDEAYADFSAAESRDIHSSAVWRVRSSSATRWAFS